MENKDLSSTDKILEKAKEIYNTNYLKDFYEPAKERINHPIIFSFICSFVVINWDLVLYLFFSSDIIESKIDRFYLHYNDYKELLIKPIILATFYIVGFPYITNLIKRALLNARKDDYMLQKDALGPAYEYKLEEASQAKALQIAIAENTDIALLNKKVSDLEHLNKSLDIQYIEQKSLLDNVMKELRESQLTVNNTQMETQKKELEHVEEVRNIKLEQGSVLNNFSIHFNKIFSKLYDKSKFNPDLFQDSFDFQKHIDKNQVTNFINFIKDRMKYFGIFTSEILVDELTNGSIKFTVYLNYPNFTVNNETKKTLINMFNDLTFTKEG